MSQSNENTQSLQGFSIAPVGSTREPCTNDCSIKELEVKCEHKDRTPKKNGKKELHIVADTDKEMSAKISNDGVEIKGEDGSLEIGPDKIAAEMGDTGFELSKDSLSIKASDGFEMDTSGADADVGDLEAARQAYNDPNADQQAAEVQKEEEEDEKKKLSLGDWGIEVKKKYAGDDKVKAKVTTYTGEGPKQACCVTEGESGSNWKDAGEFVEFEILAPEPKGDLIDPDEFWPMKAEPDRYEIIGRGCDDIQKRVLILNFPSQQHSIEVSLEIISAVVEKINKGFKQWGKKFFAASPAEMSLKLKGPQGEIKAEWGWKEKEKDYLAYFEVLPSVALKPLIGFEIELTLSVLAVAGTAFAIPPAITKFLGKHLADILLSVYGGIEGNIEISLSYKRYYSGEEDVSGNFTPSITGTIGLKITGRIGSDYILSGSITGSGEAKATIQFKFEIKSEGFFGEPSAKLDSVEFKVVLKWRAFKIFGGKTKERKWTPWKNVSLYQGNEIKFFPKDKGSGSGH
ncbi:MAG: hypothetical protein B6244_06180 [Candidatus Cloacimonetes bacterium 4572_55]|nr:MAG: hypothetical protein B6244_06180 [Candidatus Cloacimonetes bacterium 4572_55]